MKNLTLLFTTILLLTLNIRIAKAQKQYSVIGKIKDDSTKENLAFATVSITPLNNDSSTISMITDLKGEFGFNVNTGKYKIIAHFLGYKDFQEFINVTDQDVYLKNINLSIDNTAIKEVKITGASYKEQFDRSVQLVTKEFKEGTNNLKDLLSKIRGVNVNPLDNSIRVDNDENVLLLVDGVKKESTYVKNLPPDRISRIEISRNPTGQYISEGYNAVINVILKKDHTGYFVNLDDLGCYSLDKSNGDDIVFYNNVDANLLYSLKKINIYAGYRYSVKNVNFNTENEKYFNNSSIIQNELTNDPNYQGKVFSYTYIFGTDFFLSEGQTLSFEMNLIHSPLKKNEIITSFNNRYQTEDLITEFSSQQTAKKSTDQYYSQLSYRNNFSEKDHLEIDYCYDYKKMKNLNSYAENLITISNQDISLKQNTSIVDLNFKHHFNDIYLFEFGYKNTIRKNNYLYLTTNDSTEINKDFRNLFYSYLSITPQSKMKTKIGFAIEQDKLVVSTQKSFNTSLQPFINIHYNHNKNLNFTLKLNSQSSYPTSDQISPFETTIDRFSSETGNPELTCSTKYTTSLDVCLLGNKVSVEPYYKYINNFISKVGEINDSSFVYSYSNIDKYESYGFKCSTNFNLIPKKLLLKDQM